MVAPHVGDAWSLLFDFPGPVHVALIDLVLSGASGLEFADDLVEGFPLVRVIFMTGATLPPDVELARSRGPVLEKPFLLTDLIDMVES